MTTDQNTVQAVETSFEVIEALQELGASGVTELADHLDRSTSGVHKQLVTLREIGYVIKDGTSYRLGLRFLDLGTFARQQVQLYDLAKDEVDNLSRMTNLAGSLVIRDGASVVYLHCSNSDDLDVRIRPGSRVPVERSVAGKVLLAFSQDNEPLVEDLENELRDIRNQGLAVGHDEEFQDIRSAAVPILDTDDEPHGALCVSCNSSNSRSSIDQHTPGLLLDAATAIQREAVQKN